MAGPQSRNVRPGPQAAAARGAGPRENHRERPENAQAAAAQPQLGSLIQATFPFPLLHAVLAPSRRSSSAHPASRIPTRPAHPWDPSMRRSIKDRRPLPELPRVESLTVPPVPATLRHYRGPRSSTRRLGVPYWPEGSSIPCERGGDSMDL